jgi:ketosteroid isomerase-like protein
MTGLRCDGAAGSIAYVLTDSLQNEDGSWKVISERITHNFTTAIITPLETVTVSAAEFTADQYGNIFQCGHASLPLGSDITAPSTPPATSPAPPATGGTAAPTTAPTAVDYGNDAFVAAWSSGDDATLALLGTPDAVSAVHAHDDIRGGPWTLVASEGAMGTGYATYADPNGNELTIGTGNEAAATGQPHAVYTVQFP